MSNTATLDTVDRFDIIAWKIDMDHLWHWLFHFARVLQVAQAGWRFLTTNAGIPLCFLIIDGLHRLSDWAAKG